MHSSVFICLCQFNLFGADKIEAKWSGQSAIVKYLFCFYRNLSYNFYLKDLIKYVVFTKYFTCYKRKKYEFYILIKFYDLCLFHSFCC